ncbi:hypothetical protein [Croceimicrobium hydrocarbonivorans]|uniref:Uncharacterized protein n=1 Tax=Croceimicrobium hydrocarbonivorans TaxID=2761580 RepID=A0A7H0VAL2_9FLAO|nr:hypothetical protein [Croceimicrobium hydrocarbonivorans]QNR22760.1 hypothetical protein H4K34_10240 [Croceimicrobium hydrocarbonivorans]
MKLSIQFTVLMLLSLQLSSRDIQECGFRPGLKIDDQLISLKDSIAGSDTLLLYRHWPSMNGQNGYGKAILIRVGKVYRKRFDFINESLDIEASEWELAPEAQPVIQQINKVAAKKDSFYQDPTYSISHDGMQVLEVYAGKKMYYSYCDFDSWLAANPSNNQIAILKTLQDSGRSFSISYSYQVHQWLSGKSVPNFDPNLYISDADTNKYIFIYTHHKFLWFRDKYQWNGKAWEKLD